MRHTLLLVLLLTLASCDGTSPGDDEPHCNPNPPEGHLDYFPLEVGQVMVFDYTKGRGGSAWTEPSREIGTLRWEVRTEACVDGILKYRIREAFEGVAQWIDRYEPDSQWQDLHPVFWMAELTVVKEGAELDLGRYALAPVAWAHPSSALDTVKVVQPTGYRGGSVSVALARGVGLVERTSQQNSGLGYGSDYETLRRRE